ncbi:MAG: hypothetical protein ACOZF0_21565 [Thermodesulfobacteriota bacterium]
MAGGDIQDNRETPHGILYKPRGIGWQVLALFGSLIGMLPVSRLVSILLDGLSDKAETVLFLPLFFILLMGYGLWLTRLNAIAFHFLGKVLLRAFFNLIVRVISGMCLAWGYGLTWLGRRGCLPLPEEE